MDEKIKILHIVSVSFNYFDDIRQKVFLLSEAEKKFGVDSHIITLQYNTSTKRIVEKNIQETPDISFCGHHEVSGILEILDEFTLINIHGPFLGVGRILRKIKENKKIIFTWHRGVRLSDMFSYFVWLYNEYFLAKFCQIAKAIAFFDEQDFYRQFGKKYFNDNYRLADIVKDGEEIIKENSHLTLSQDGVKLKVIDGQALAFIQLYKFLNN
jgi:hypothetical protein